MIETISVTEMYLRNLIWNSLLLEAYQVGGVDNWEGSDWVKFPTKEQVDKEIQDLKDNPV